MIPDGLLTWWECLSRFSSCFVYKLFRIWVNEAETVSGVLLIDVYPNKNKFPILILFMFEILTVPMSITSYPSAVPSLPLKFKISPLSPSFFNKKSEGTIILWEIFWVYKSVKNFAIYCFSLGLIWILPNWFKPCFDK